jgi:hypothetical protein
MHILSRPRIVALTASLLLGTLFFSCASAPKSATPEEDRGIMVKDPKTLVPPEKPGEDDTAAETIPPEIVPPPPASFPPPELPPEEPPVEPREGLYIMGDGRLDPADLSDFFLDNNPGADPFFVEELASLYREEAAIEGINHDIAFVQMCLETGFLRFGGLVTPEMNNFCGLGSIGPGQPFYGR